MPDNQQLHELINLLPDTELSAAARYLQFLLAQEAPVDPDMLARIDAARSEPSSGTSRTKKSCGNMACEAPFSGILRARRPPTPGPRYRNTSLKDSDFGFDSCYD